MRVAKPPKNSGLCIRGLYIAKIVRVAKHVIRLRFYFGCLYIAKIVRVAKLSNLISLPEYSLYIAKIVRVAKQMYN